MAGRDDELNALDMAESSTDISERSVDGTHERKTCAQGFLTQGVQRTGSGTRACGNTRAHPEDVVPAFTTFATDLWTLDLTFLQSAETDKMPSVSGMYPSF